MNRQMLVLAISLLLAAGTVTAADNVCPCIPIDHAWIATPCDSWNCAQAAVILSAGDPYVMTMPMASDSVKWVVIRRVAAGSYIVSPDNPLDIDAFDSLSDLSARFAALDVNTKPVIVSGMDGKLILVRLRQPEPRRRAVTPR